MQLTGNPIPQFRTRKWVFWLALTCGQIRWRVDELGFEAYLPHGEEKRNVDNFVWSPLALNGFGNGWMPHVIVVFFTALKSESMARLSAGYALALSSIFSYLTAPAVAAFGIYKYHWIWSVKKRLKLYRLGWLIGKKTRPNHSWW